MLAELRGRKLFMKYESCLEIQENICCSFCMESEGSGNIQAVSI
jgi:hypothetical protein